MTGIHLPSLGGGWQEYGRQTREHMIARYRRNAQIAKEEAERILAASDDEFVVETYLGPFAQRQREEIPPEPKASAPDRQVGHDEACEADWGPEGQESPCRCAERAHQAEAPSDGTEFIDTLNRVWHHRLDVLGAARDIAALAARPEARAALGVVPEQSPHPNEQEQER